MKKVLLSTLSFLMLTMAHAQLRYTFSSQSGQAYSPLTTGAINLSANMAWDEDTFSVAMPFNFLLDGQALPKLRVTNDGALTIFGRRSANGDTATGFLVMDGDLHDRGNATTSGNPQSPIRYAITGTSPSRIFKLEYFNAGFVEDGDNVDSVNFQLWLYETSNIVELHYGPRHLSEVGFFGLYFPLSNGVFVGYFKDVDFANGTYGKLYYLNGTVAAPVIDSSLLPSLPTSSLSGFPASGRVYRFTPTSNGGTASISQAIIAARALTLYPSIAAESITVIWTGQSDEAYEIVSAEGRRVGSGFLQSGNQSIPLRHLATGTYFLKLATGAHQFSKR